MRSASGCDRPLVFPGAKTRSAVENRYASFLPYAFGRRASARSERT
jgi:hypothetical protein